MSTQLADGWVPDPFSTFGARLATVRHEAGWTNVRMAALACDLDAESWRAWETQGRRPRDYYDVCEKIAKRSGCSLMWLLSGKGDTGVIRGYLPNAA